MLTTHRLARVSIAGSLRVLMLFVSIAGVACSGSGGDDQPPAASPDPTPSASPTPTPSASATPTPTATPSASPTPVPTAAPTAAPTASPTPTPSASATPTVSPTASPTPTPTPLPTPTPTPPEGTSALDCLNPTLYVIGSRVEATSEIIGEDSTRDYDVLVVRETEFKGATAIETESHINTHRARTTQPTTYPWRLLSYDRLPESGTQTLHHGFIGGENPTTFENSRESASYDPPIVFRYDLEPGAEYTQSYVVTRDDKFPACQVQCYENPPPYTAVRTTRYVGREAIDVPLGRLETCRFETESDDPRDRRPKTLWIGVGNGLVVRRTNHSASGEYDEVEALVSAAINGEPVRAER
jgi:hypothetical protein